MKRLAYKTGALIAAAVFLSASVLTAQEITKSFHQEYTAEKGKTLNLNNRYGDIVVETSASNQIVIDVKVTMKYPNKERAEKLMSYIDVQFSQDAEGYSAKTSIDDRFSFTGWGLESRKFSIDYSVKMPEWLNLDLVNRYGNTDLDDLSSLVNLDVKYGNLNASNLSRGDEKPMSKISVAYGNCTIDKAGWLDLSIRYSGNFSVEKAQALLLDSKYSKVRLGSVSSVVGEERYDNMRIESVNNLVLDGGYSDINIGTLLKKLKFNGGYGGFNVERVPAGFESIDVDTDYTGVRLGIDESAEYNLEAKTSYSGLKYNDVNFQVKRRIIENTSSEVSGIVGKGESPKSTVRVKASYGSVKLL